MAEAFTVPIQRLLLLRQFAPFASIDLGELAMVADNVVETTFAAGTEIVRRGVRMPAMHLVIEGRIAAGGEVWGPRQVYGLFEALSHREVGTAAVAAVDTRTFQLSSGDAREVLEDNFGLLRGVLRELAGRLVAMEPRRTAPAGVQLVPSPGGLTLVERLIVLRQHVPFAGGRLQALAAVAQTAEDRTWSAGEVIAHAGTAADGAIMILEGTVRVSQPGRSPRVLGPGDNIGGLEALAGLRHLAIIEAVTPVYALWCPGPVIFDVLEDHTDLGLTMIRTFAGALLDSAGRPSN